MPVINCGVQLLRGRLDRSSAGFEHNHVVPGSRKLNGYNNSDRAAADNNDLTGGQLRGRDLVKLQDHGRGNLRRRERWRLRSERTTRARERSGIQQRFWGRPIMRVREGSIW